MFFAHITFLSCPCEEYFNLSISTSYTSKVDPISKRVLSSVFSEFKSLFLVFIFEFSAIKLVFFNCSSSVLPNKEST